MQNRTIPNIIKRLRNKSLTPPLYIICGRPNIKNQLETKFSVPLSNLLYNPAQNMLILKVIEQALQEKYEWGSFEVPSWDKNYLNFSLYFFGAKSNLFLN
jgi:hypothetical protein